MLFEVALLGLVAFGAVKAAHWGFDTYYRSAYPLKYTALIDAACEEKNLDKAFVYAVVRTESGFNPDAQSSVGARGLMQLMPDAYDWIEMRKGNSTEQMDYDLLFDPETNIEYGASMLRILFDEFETPTNVLCAYHAGWGSAKSWLKNPAYAPDGETITTVPFKDTSAYVAKVEKTAEIYRKLYSFSETEL